MNNKNTVPQEEQRFNNIMNTRKEVKISDVGTPIRCKVQSALHDYWDERLVSPSTGEVGALKDIYSFNVSKATVLDSKWFADKHAAACAAEAAGDTDAARKLFNEAMNNCQLSHGVINRDGTKPRFVKDQVVDVTLDVTDVEDKDANGNPLGTTHKAIIVTGMYPVQAKLASAGRRFGAAVVEETSAPAIPVGSAVPAQ
jgi:hypothetical protein